MGFSKKFFGKDSNKLSELERYDYSADVNNNYPF
jgi:hypothetical protein